MSKGLVVDFTGELPLSALLSRLGLPSGAWPANPRSAMPLMSAAIQDLGRLLDGVRAPTDTLEINSVVSNQYWAGSRIVLSQGAREGAAVRIAWFPRKPDKLKVFVEPWSRQMSWLEWLRIPLLVGPLVPLLFLQRDKEHMWSLLGAGVLCFAIGLYLSAKIVGWLASFGIGIDLAASKLMSARLVPAVRGWLDQPVAVGATNDSSAA